MNERDWMELVQKIEKILTKRSEALRKRKSRLWKPNLLKITDYCQMKVQNDFKIGLN